MKDQDNQRRVQSNTGRAPPSPRPIQRYRNFKVCEQKFPAIPCLDLPHLNIQQQMAANQEWRLIYLFIFILFFIIFLFFMFFVINELYLL